MAVRNVCLGRLQTCIAHRSEWKFRRALQSLMFHTAADRRRHLVL